MGRKGRLEGDDGHGREKLLPGWWRGNSFPSRQHMMEFSLSGKLIGILGLLCMNASYEISTGASEALHYLFKILVLHRSK